MPEANAAADTIVSDGIGTAAITGASAGIGRIYAERLAARGHDLILVARRGDRLEALAQELRLRNGIQVRVLVADLGDTMDLERVAEALSSDARITLLVNNAGTSTLKPFHQVDEEALDAMTDLNVSALVQLTRAVLPGFRQRNVGTIVNIGSVLGFSAIPGLSAYSGTKGYVLNFTRGLQDEVAGTNVRVQLVLPGAIATDLWEIAGLPLSNLDPGIVMSPEAVVDAALAGLDLGEAVTLPSVEDVTLLERYDTARLQLLGASQTGKPASRYLRS